MFIRGGEVTFSDAEFTGGEVTFSDAEFSGGEVDFSDASFGGRVNLAEATGRVTADALGMPVPLPDGVLLPPENRTGPTAA
jgi:Pentapeptide repeats (9 copies)